MDDIAMFLKQHLSDIDTFKFIIFKQRQIISTCWHASLLLIFEKIKSFITHTSDVDRIT